MGTMQLDSPVQNHHSVLSLWYASRKATILRMWQGSPQSPGGAVMDDKVDLSHSGTAVCQGPCVVKISYIKTNRANFYFLKNILLFGLFSFLASSLFCHEQAGKLWPCHGNYLTTSELFCTQGREVGRASQSSVLNCFKLSCNFRNLCCPICSSLLLLCTLLWTGHYLLATYFTELL